MTGVRKDRSGGEKTVNEASKRTGPSAVQTGLRLWKQSHHLRREGANGAAHLSPGLCRVTLSLGFHQPAGFQLMTAPHLVPTHRQA